jgi:hypothetical protein
LERSHRRSQSAAASAGVVRKSLRVAARRVQLMWLNQHSSRPLQKYRVRMLVGEVSFLVDQVDLAEPDQDGAASHPALAGVPFRSQQPFSPNETASPSSRNSIMLPCTQGRRQGQERVCGGHGPASATAPTRWPLHASATASALAQVCRPRYNSSFANVSTLFQSQDLFKACKCRPIYTRPTTTQLPWPANTSPRLIRG